MNKKIFILSKENYIIDMISNSINDYNDCEQQEFIENCINNLINIKGVIEFDEDLLFIVGYDYKNAQSIFGKSICNSDMTKNIIAEILIKIYDINILYYQDIVENIYFEKEFENRIDIDNWIKEQKQKINEIKKYPISYIKEDWTHNKNICSLHTPTCIILD